MSEQLPPPDLFIKLTQFVPTVHRDVYASIDPTSAKLSQQGKKIIVTGAGGGIGRGIALSFAKANASAIVLVGRNAENLEATKALIAEASAATAVHVVKLDITKPDDVSSFEHSVQESVGTPDVLINSAGTWGPEKTVGDSDPEAWWKDMETNIKGTYLMTRAFIRAVGPKAEATIINVVSINVQFISPGTTSYHIGKLAQTRLAQYVAAENPNITAIAIHPGIIKTSMTSDHPAFFHFSRDTVELAGGVSVYLCTSDAKYLNGRYVSANWSVDDLKEKEKEIVSQDLLKFDLKGTFGSDQFGA